MKPLCDNHMLATTTLLAFTDAHDIAFTVPSSQIRQFLDFVLAGGGDRREQPKPQFKGSRRPLGG